MRRDADIEELHTTKSEKLLALVMTAFLLIGGLWIYQKLDDEVRHRVAISAGSAADRAAIERANRARAQSSAAERRVRNTRRQVDFTREEWRAALDASRPAAALERRYRAAQSTYDAALREREQARRALARVAPPGRTAAERIAREQAEDRDRQELYVLLARLALVLVALAPAYWLLAALRRRNSRWLPLAAAAVGYATILAFVLAGDYLTDYLDPFDYGVALLALVGVVATAGAYWAVQRYLVRWLPQRRARKAECPFCGYPVRGNERCEGCGRDVVAECAACHRPRRVGVQFCGACGSR